MVHATSQLTTHAKSVVEAINNSDWNAMRDLIGDTTYVEVGTQRSVKGDAIIEAMHGWKTAFPDAKGVVTNAVESGQQVVLEVTWTGTQTGDMVTEQGTIPASGKQQTTHAAFVFEYENGNLKQCRHYFALLGLLLRIGAA